MYSNTLMDLLLQLFIVPCLDTVGLSEWHPDCKLSPSAMSKHFPKKTVAKPNPSHGNQREKRPDQQENNSL